MKVTNITKTAYARKRGITEGAVRDAAKKGIFTPEPDGKVNPVKADKEWDENTIRIKNKVLNTKKVTTLVEVKTAGEVVKVKREQLLLKRLEGKLLDKKDVEDRVFRFIRIERDGWINWVGRVSSPIASKLKVDIHELQLVLEHYVREHLEEISKTKRDL